MGVLLPVADNDQGIQVLSPVGPAATKQTIDNAAVYKFTIPVGTYIRCASSQDMNVRTLKPTDTAPLLADLQSTGYVKAGSVIVLRSRGIVYVTGTATGVSFAPDTMAGTELDE